MPADQEVYVTRVEAPINIEILTLVIEGIRRGDDGKSIIWLSDDHRSRNHYVLYVDEWPIHDNSSMIYVKDVYLSQRAIEHVADIGDLDEVSSDIRFLAVAPMELWVSKAHAENYFETVRRLYLE